ncbi:hypothetical protein BDN72DRAFT_903468 [Pluteus cervinus]|uniref:Uncharacterized protein n=1 Tax=Pluteus cervinus TaxID=181527 RepID=A0ACD3A8G7_9AGAR|nr:hypothetical protein BDN72DRAFT_903468 [Pluteus cervinus]
MDPTARNGSSPPPNAFPARRDETTLRSIVLPEMNTDPKALQNASNLHESAPSSATDALNKRADDSDSTPMDVDPPQTMKDLEKSTIQDGGLEVAQFTNPSTDQCLQPETGKNTPFDSRDGDEDQDGERDEDMEESDLSEGEDLRDDVDLALSELNFNASYAVGKAFPLAPNPWLTIEGLGLIGLPLSQGDAKRIISSSKQPAYGLESANAVNTDVRNAWEVSSQVVSFGNSDWDAFLKKQVLAAARDGLGFTADTNALRLRLHKLLLYETGSQSLPVPHQDTSKVEGAFATVTVILPSYYAGGEIRVSHPAGSKVLSLPPNSFFQTSMLAWYADGTHSVQPVQSGYLLALSYNLIHTVPNLPTLTLPPTGDKIAFVRRTLKKWHKKKYNEDEDSEYDSLAFLFDHRYSAKELSRGSKALKGKDAHIVANLCPIAEEMDFVLLLASLKYTKSGHREDGDEEDVDISNIVNLDGNLVIGKKSSSTAWGAAQVIPKGAFEGAEPDGDEVNDCDYESGESGDVAITEWYNRTTLILFHESWKQDFIISVGGLKYAISKLKKVDPLAPTEDSRQLVKRVAAFLSSDHGDTATPSDWDDITKIALSWKSLEIWKAICEERIASSKGIDSSPYKKALKIFSFEELRITLEQILASTTYLSQRLGLIRSILSHASKDNSILGWCRTQIFRALTIQRLKEDDIPLIIKVIQTEGISETLTHIIPSLYEPTVTSDIWVILLRSILRIAEAANSPDEQPGDWKEFIPQCLDRAIDPNRAVDDSRVKSSVELISLVVSFGFPDLASRVLDTLLSVTGPLLFRFKYMYSPLVPLLQQTLAKYHISITTPPFSTFAQNIIGLHLRYLLGGKDQIIQTVVKTFSCSAACTDCKTLDAFMASWSTEHGFRVNERRQNHVQRQIDLGKGRDIVSFSVTGATLVIRKKSEIVAASQWPTRQANARAFLKLFGASDVIAQLTGTEGDVAMALDGIQAFRWTEASSVSSIGGISTMAVATVTAGPSQAAQPSSSLPSAGTSGSRQQVDSSTQEVAGRKRVRTKQTAVKVPMSISF